MLVDGLWTVEFATSLGQGSGVATFVDGNVLGGDSSYYYVGRYSASGSSIKARLTVMHYSGPMSNVFGPLREIQLEIDGAFSGDLIMARGHIPTARHMQMSLRLKRVQHLLGDPS